MDAELGYLRAKSRLEALSVKAGGLPAAEYLDSTDNSTRTKRASNWAGLFFLLIWRLNGLDRSGYGQVASSKWLSAGSPQQEFIAAPPRVESIN